MTTQNGQMTRERTRSAREALDELLREMNMRSRCFPRWITEQRVSRTDAQDRLDRMASAVDIVESVMQCMTEAQMDEPFVKPPQKPVKHAAHD